MALFSPELMSYLIIWQRGIIAHLLRDLSVIKATSEKRKKELTRLSYVEYFT